MIPVKFKQANKTFGPPVGFEESQVMPIPVYVGTIERGAIEGAPVLVTAWLPSPAELQALINGRPIYISFMGATLPPHFPTVRFVDAISPGVNLREWTCPAPECGFKNAIQIEGASVTEKKAHCEKCDAEITIRFT